MLLWWRINMADMKRASTNKFSQLLVTTAKALMLCPYSLTTQPRSYMGIKTTLKCHFLI